LAAPDPFEVGYDLGHAILHAVAAAPFLENDRRQGLAGQGGVAVDNNIPIRRVTLDF